MIWTVRLSPFAALCSSFSLFVRHPRGEKSRFQLFGDTMVREVSHGLLLRRDERF
jgi:hypothetical protein